MNKRVLAVDDDPLILKGIEIVLEDAGYTVECCNQARDAKKRVESFKPDIIILDVMLGDSDGRVIARTLKKSPRTKDIPIIMISANQHVKKDIFTFGIDTFIPKPFDSTTMIEAVKQLTV